MDPNKLELKFSKRMLLNNSVGPKTHVFGVFALSVSGGTTLPKWPESVVLALFLPFEPPMHPNKLELKFSKLALPNNTVGPKTYVFGVFTLTFSG